MGEKSLLFFFFCLEKQYFFFGGVRAARWKNGVGIFVLIMDKVLWAAPFIFNVISDMKIVLDRKEEPMLYAAVFSLKFFFFWLYQNQLSCYEILWWRCSFEMVLFQWHSFKVLSDFSLRAWCKQKHFQSGKKEQLRKRVAFIKRNLNLALPYLGSSGLLVELLHR